MEPRRGKGREEIGAEEMEMEEKRGQGNERWRKDGRWGEKGTEEKNGERKIKQEKRSVLSLLHCIFINLF